MKNRSIPQHTPVITVGERTLGDAELAAVAGGDYWSMAVAFAKGMLDGMRANAPARESGIVDIPDGTLA
ncbi:MAG: hypothetical protein K8W52_22120 [Deltaproteobacteria bacterium]|nr:hypothetical protein [Deltaproteobacteria bacterium]